MKHSKVAVWVCLATILALPLLAETQSATPSSPVAPAETPQNLDQDKSPAAVERLAGEAQPELSTETEPLAAVPQGPLPGFFGTVFSNGEGAVLPAMIGNPHCETPCSPCDNCFESTTGSCCTQLLGRFCAAVAQCQCLQCAQ